MNVNPLDSNSDSSSESNSTTTKSKPSAIEVVVEQVAEESRVDHLDLGCRIEAALMTSDRPLGPKRLGTIAAAGGDPIADADLDQAVEELNALYDKTGRSFRIEHLAGGYQVMTRPEFGPVVYAAKQAKTAVSLSKAAMETLAIVAYRQPVTRSEIEGIRGVGCGEILRKLLEQRLIKVTGRADEIGRPMQYGTGREFLEAFGLASLKDLPEAKDLRTP